MWLLEVLGQGKKLGPAINVATLNVQVKVTSSTAKKSVLFHARYVRHWPDVVVLMVARNAPGELEGPRRLLKSLDMGKCQIH